MTDQIRNLTNNQQLANARRHGETNAVASSAKGNGRDGNSPSTTHSGEYVSLTDTALHVQNVERQLADAPVMDRERIEELRQAIANGVYSVRADLIAEKIIELEHDVSGKN